MSLLQHFQTVKRDVPRKRGQKSASATAPAPTAAAVRAPVLSHQLTPEEEAARTRDLALLAQFDLDMRYGPCADMPRIKRWQLAENDGMSPPREILQLVADHEDDVAYTHCLWHNRL